MSEHGKKPEILVVDDTPENIDVLNNILKEQYRVKVALNGEKALTAATSKDSPDLILLDIMMPNMDGYEVCRRLKENDDTKDIPVIFVTAKGEMKDELLGFQEGAVDYITKPINPKITLARIRTQLELRDSYRRLEELNLKVEETLKEKQILMQELQHRTRNNLQMISSLIRMRAKKIQEGETKETLTQVLNSIQSMATLHENLLNSENLVEVNAKDYITSLAKELVASFQCPADKVEMIIEADEVACSVDSWIYIGLIINELITNSLKHAFPDSRKGRVEISLRSMDNANLELIIKDNGVGIPGDEDVQNFKTLGFKLINSFLKSRLRGNMVLNGNAGTEIKINMCPQ